MRRRCWDVVVVGGGPAGSVCAMLLAQNNWRVMLAEAGTYSKPRLADTLCPTTARRLRVLTGCDLTGSDVAVPCRGTVAQWGTTARRITDYELNLGGQGWTVARPEIDRLLFERAQRAGVQVREGWRRVEYSSAANDGPQEVRFVTKNGVRTEEANMLVDATGRSAPPRNGHHVFFDRQLAFATSWKESPEKLKGFLWMENTSAGWWYVNAAPRGQIQLVFVTNNWRGRVGPAQRMRFFQNEFECCEMLKELELVTPGKSLPELSVYDARLCSSVGVSQERLVYAGDAAATSDPLSGRGWLRALDSAQAAAAAASQALTMKSCEPITSFRQGSIAALAHHVRVRRELNAELEVDHGEFGRPTRPMTSPV